MKIKKYKFYLFLSILHVGPFYTISVCFFVFFHSTNTCKYKMLEKKYYHQFLNQFYIKIQFKLLISLLFLVVGNKQTDILTIYNQKLQLEPNIKTLGMEKSIKFIIATDVHLGHKQSQAIRKNDSFNAFEQVLSIATLENADFMLLGGDLFDEVNPSQKTIYKCLDILQHYVQGEGKKDLHSYWTDHPQYRINFSNQNMSIKLPIFTIHGNHDYPSNDFGKISICDLLHVSNYANYFGKHTNLSQITIKPMIIQKQGVKIKIAVYGLGYIKDNVLNQLFDKGKVKFQELQNRDEYFRLFIFHQNRYKKGLRAGAPALKCVSSKHIPTWIDLTIWGHEHEAISRIDIEDDRQIFQPGSTVITSFIEAQSYLKQCLKIQILHNGEINIDPIPLVKSYRPMFCRNYQLQQLSRNHCKDSQVNFDPYVYLDNQMNNIIQSSEKQFPGKRPIVRMKIQYTGFQISRSKMLQLKYSEKVANPESILSFWKRKQEKPKNDDKTLFQAFKDKGDINFQQKQITEQILVKYLKSQQNQFLYYDPRQLYKHHHNSMQNQSNCSKDEFGAFFSREIQKKSKPTIKEIQHIYKSSIRENDIIVRNKMSNILKNINLDFSSDDQQNNIQQDKPQRSIRNLWEDQKKILLIKQHQINSVNLNINYGENLIEFERKPNLQNENLKKQASNKKQRQSNHQNISVPAEWINPESSKSNQFEKMEIQESYLKGQRQGILKKHYMQTQDRQHQHDEQDCCKRAERTEYDQANTKNNFSGAQKMVKGNAEKKGKKNAKIKEEKRKKSVKWNDSDLEY